MLENYITRIYKVVEHELVKYGMNSNENVLEYDIMFILAINGIPVYTSEKNVIMAQLSNEGIVKIDYNWAQHIGYYVLT